MANPFTKSAKEARERGEIDLARRIMAEGRIAGALVFEIIRRGYSVGVDDGEERVIKASRNIPEIMATMFSTDEDHVYAVSILPHDEAHFYLVYGNYGYDVISDYSDNELGNAVWNTLEPLMSKIEAQLG